MKIHTQQSRDGFHNTKIFTKVSRAKASHFIKPSQRVKQTMFSSVSVDWLYSIASASATYALCRNIFLNSIDRSSGIFAPIHPKFFSIDPKSDAFIPKSCQAVTFLYCSFPYAPCRQASTQPD